MKHAMGHDDPLRVNVQRQSGSGASRSGQDRGSPGGGTGVNERGGKQMGRAQPWRGGGKQVLLVQGGAGGRAASYTRFEKRRRPAGGRMRKWSCGASRDGQ